MLAESNHVHDLWKIFIRELKDNYFKFHFADGVLGKKVSIFGSGFDLKKNSDKPTLHTIIKVKESDFDIPNSFMCKISNREWKGKYMTRDQRGKSRSTFGYNSTGGELVKINLITPVEDVVANNLKVFSVRLFIEGKDNYFGNYYGVHSKEGKLYWGHESNSEIVEIEKV